MVRYSLSALCITYNICNGWWPPVPNEMKRNHVWFHMEMHGAAWIKLNRATMRQKHTGHSRHQIILSTVGRVTTGKINMNTRDQHVNCMRSMSIWIFRSVSDSDYAKSIHFAHTHTRRQHCCVGHDEDERERSSFMMMDISAKCVPNDERFPFNRPHAHTHTHLITGRMQNDRLRAKIFNQIDLLVHTTLAAEIDRESEGEREREKGFN